MIAQRSSKFGQIGPPPAELGALERLKKSTCIIFRMRSNFGQIGPPTMELSALESLKYPHRLIMGNMVSQQFLGCFYPNF